MADVIITPASGLIDFQNTSGISSATIQLDGNGNLSISAAAGDIEIGDTASDIFVGDGVANVDIVFEEDGEIRGLTGKTITLGQSDSFVAFAGTVTGDVTFTGKLVFPDNGTVPDNPTNEQYDYMTFGANGSISQVSGRGALMIASSDDSLILANGDVGRNFTDSNINVDPEDIFLLSDSGVYFKTNLQGGWGVNNYTFGFTAGGQAQFTSLDLSSTGTALVVDGGMTVAGVSTFSGGQVWASNITWNNGANILISGESSFDVRSGGQWQVWDQSTANNWITASYGQPLILNSNALNTTVKTSGSSDYFRIYHRTDTDITMDFWCESGTAQIADTFADTTTDKKYIYFGNPNSSNDPGFIMHETSNSETNEGVIHLCPSDDNAEDDYISIHGTDDPDRLKLHTSGLIETANVQLELRSGSNQVYVNDDLKISGGIHDGTSLGTSGQVLSSTGTGLSWIDAAAGGGGSGTFDTGITTSIYVSVNSGVGTDVSTTNDIFVGPDTAYTFPSTAGKKYVIESIHITNTFADELYFVGRHDFNGGLNVPIAQRVIVPYQGATEFLDQPIIANPSDVFKFQALTGTGSTATGIDGGLDAFIVFSTKDDTDYIGVGKTVSTAAGTEIFQATSNPAMLQSIKLCNYSLSSDIDASISIYNGGLSSGTRLGYLVYNLTVPKNSVIEILEKPKYLATNAAIVGGASAANVLGVTIAGKYIT